MAIKFTMINASDKYSYVCPECDKKGIVSGDQIDIAKRNREPLELNCGHTITLEN